MLLPMLPDYTEFTWCSTSNGFKKIGADHRLKLRKSWIRPSIRAFLFVCWDKALFIVTTLFTYMLLQKREQRTCMSTIKETTIP